MHAGEASFTIEGLQRWNPFVIDFWKRRFVEAFPRRRGPPETGEPPPTR
jgi:hypothetical protein